MWPPISAVSPAACRKISALNLYNTCLTDSGLRNIFAGISPGILKTLNIESKDVSGAAGMAMFPAREDSSGLE